MAAFGDLYDRLADTLFSLAMKILTDSGAAEDVSQEVFVQIFPKAHTYDPRLGKPLTWAITLTRNRAIDRLRSVQRGQRLFTPETGEQKAKDTTTPGADDTLIGQEAAQRVRTALADLPPDQREAIEMACFHGMSQSEISVAQGAPLRSTPSAVWMARSCRSLTD
jgi:RNA polymerase sigma-70 factor (ECF subfamily)